MAAARSEGFRFRPPPVAATGELRWVLARAFGPPSTTPPSQLAPAALELASALGLAPRIAARLAPAQRERELGTAASSELGRLAAGTIAEALRQDVALAALDEVAADLKLRCLLLKGRALSLGGHAVPHARPAADVDLLVPERRLAELARSLASHGFTRYGVGGYEHHAPALRHEAGALVELHRSIPGLRPDGRRFARLEAVERADAIDERAVATEAGPLHAVRLPVPALLGAHALAHALAQHATVATFQGLVAIADLIDLGLVQDRAAFDDSPVARWIERDVAPAETRSAFGLARLLAAGVDPFLLRDDDLRRVLAAHFVALALDPDYGVALKARMFERPLSELPAPLARARLLAAALAGGERGFLARAVDLARRWRRARRVAAATSGPRRD